jgi:small subunit ribosomal protein S21
MSATHVPCRPDRVASAIASGLLHNTIASRPGRAEIRARRSPLQVTVRDNNVDQALRVLKKKLQREGLFREMKRRRAYEKPSEKKARKAGEAVRRARKAARKAAQREGLVAGASPSPSQSR